MSEKKLKSGVITFIGLANEYCVAVENALQEEKDDFVGKMLDLLPRLYITIRGTEAVEPDMLSGMDAFSRHSYMDEDYYDTVRGNLERLMGEDDIFLETFEEDMKYSDTPIAVSISESLADIFQSLYNFVSVVRDTDGDSADEAFADCKENFEEYWGQTLCNVLRPLNSLHYRQN